MGKVQGINKEHNSTTINWYRRSGREKVELVWDGSKYLIYVNGVYLRDLVTDIKIPTTSIEVWNPDVNYEANSTFVSFINETSPTEQFQTEAIYRCAIDTQAGESPEIAQEKWIYQGSTDTVSDLKISDVQDLRTELDDRIKYSDLNSQFNVDPNTKQISLNVEYITVSDYKPSNDIPPVGEEASWNIPADSASMLEGGSVLGFARLGSKPVDNIVIDLASDDITSVTISPTTMTFTPTNWNDPQQYTINSIVDPDGDSEVVNITFSTQTSADTRYNNLADKVIPVSVIDSSNAAIVTTITTGSVTENESITMGVYLASQPVQDVIIDVVSADPVRLIPSTSSVVIQSDEWNQPVTVGFTAPFDGDTVVNDVICTFSLSGNNTDPIYQPGNIDDVDITITINEPLVPEEVILGGITWKGSNTDFDNGSSLITVYGGNNPGTNPDYDANVANYGRLYRQAILQTLLLNNPGYRIPTFSDVLNTIVASTNYTENTFNVRSTQAKPLLSPYTEWNDVSNVSQPLNTDGFGEPMILTSTLQLGDSGLDLRPGGSSPDDITFIEKTQRGTYWYDAGLNVRGEQQYGLFEVQGSYVSETSVTMRILLYKNAVDNQTYLNYHSVRLVKDI